MFGSFVSAPKDSTTTSSPSVFPSYLLPSQTRPIGRRHPSFTPRKHSGQAETTPLLEIEVDNDAPSLFSSPEASTSAPPSSSTNAERAFEFQFDCNGADASSQAFAKSSPATNIRRLTRMNPDTLRCKICSTDLAYGAQIVSKGFNGRHGRAYLVSPPPATPNTVPGLLPLQFPGYRHQHATSTKGVLVNIRVGRSEARHLVTGPHVVADIHCIVCHAKVGWKYLEARESTQKYKVGKFILETYMVMAQRGWDDDGVSVDGEIVHVDGMEESWCTTDGGKAGGTAVRKKVEKEGARGSHDSGVSGMSYKEDWTEEEAKEGMAAIEFDSEDDEECEEIFAGTWDAEVVAERRKKMVEKVRALKAGAQAA